MRRAYLLPLFCGAYIFWSLPTAAETPSDEAQNRADSAAEVEAALHLTPDLENGRKIFETCAVCHMPEGWGTPEGCYPQIAGQLPNVLIKQLVDIRLRNRDNPTMRPFTSPRLLGGAQEIADVVAYISKLPMTPENGVGPGDDLEYGKKLFQDNCIDCHGLEGEGDEKKHIPLIQGQHFPYLLRQFEWIRTGKRRNADKKMVQQIERFSKRDEWAVMDYVSRLRPPATKVGVANWRNPDFPSYAREPRRRPATCNPLPIFKQ